MKFEIGNIFEDWGEDACARCGLGCRPRYRICFQLAKKGRNGNEIIDEEFTLCRFCLPKIVSGWKNIIEDFCEKKEVESPDDEDWNDVNKEIMEETS